MPLDRYRWCRRIFASVDVIGSTAFKARAPEDSSGWAGVFGDFFDEFPTTLRACFAELPEVAQGRPEKEMRTWKFIGDEILFEAELGRHEHVVYHLLAFKNALNRAAAGFAAKPELGLTIKGAVWGAGFPVSNAHVLTRFGDATDPPEDFVGPCVDQGFRLCSLADARRIPISVDIAYMLAMTRLTPATTRHPLQVLCEEPKPHKGFPHSYPHIWVDRQDGARSAEDEVLERRQPDDPGKLLRYLRELYAANRPGLFRPFIVGDPSADFNVVPPKLNAKRDALLPKKAETAYTAEETPKTDGAPVTPPQAVGQPEALPTVTEGEAREPLR